MYELELSIAIIVGLIGLIGVLLKKRPHYSSSEKTTEDRITAINDIKHIHNDIKEIKNNIKDLYDGETKNHAEFDKIMGKIHEIELKFVEFMGGKK